MWPLKYFLLSFLTHGSRYIHPIDSRECPVVIGGDYITTESGTGLVHTAPGHGQEDYVTGLKYGLPVLSPVDDGGKFTEEAGQFVGLDVLGDGNMAVVKYLDEHFSLIMEESYGKLSSHPLPPLPSNQKNHLSMKSNSPIKSKIDSGMQDISIPMIGGQRSLRYLEQRSSGLPQLKDFARLL